MHLLTQYSGVLNKILFRSLEHIHYLPHKVYKTKGKIEIKQDLVQMFGFSSSILGFSC